jgi:hypothetical protein
MWAKVEKATKHSIHKAAAIATGSPQSFGPKPRRQSAERLALAAPHFGSTLLISFIHVPGKTYRKPVPTI